MYDDTLSYLPFLQLTAIWIISWVWAAMTILEQVFVWTCTFVALGKCLQVELLGDSNYILKSQCPLL